MKFEEIEFNGNTYLYYDGSFVEKGTYIIPTENILKEIAAKYYSNYNFTDKNNKELKKKIKELKENKAYSISLKVCLFYYEKNKDKIEEIRYILPVITSLYRLMHKSEKAIETNENAYKNYGKKVFSVPLFTSVAAAYCDLGDYERARKFCNIAYAEQGGGTGQENELSLVYYRIKKESGE